MLLIVEQDLRPAPNGARFTWRPGIFRGRLMKRPVCRVWWGLWSLTLIGSPGLKDFLEHVADGKTVWHSIG